MSDFRGGLAFDLVDFGWFQAPPERLQPISGPIRRSFDAYLPCRGLIRHLFDTIFDVPVVNLRFEYFAYSPAMHQTTVYTKVPAGPAEVPANSLAHSTPVDYNAEGIGTNKLEGAGDPWGLPPPRPTA